MPKLNLLITLSFITVLVIVGNVYSHKYAPPRPVPTFPYTKFSQKPKVARSIKMQVPKVRNVEMDEIIPSLTTIPETQNHKLHEFDILPVLNLNFLQVREATSCYICYNCYIFYIGYHICLGEVTVPPLSLLPPIISPIADPFNGGVCQSMSFEEFFLWLRENSW